MERPKSIDFNGAVSLESANKKFSGFKSLCITPCSWHTCKKCKKEKCLYKWEEKRKKKKIISCSLASNRKRKTQCNHPKREIKWKDWSHLGWVFFFFCKQELFNVLINGFNWLHLVGYTCVPNKEAINFISQNLWSCLFFHFGSSGYKFYFVTC